jgi:hypothetical protein
LLDVDAVADDDAVGRDVTAEKVGSSLQSSQKLGKLLSLFTESTHITLNSHILSSFIMFKV